MTAGNPLGMQTPKKPHHRARDLKGLRFGRLVVTEYAGSNGSKSLWVTRCDCGSTRTHAASELLKGRTKSCGCLRNAQQSERAATHRMSKHPAYAVWRSMLDRCRLPTHQAWARYGGRGISVCERWNSFANFWADMGPSYVSGLTLDRRDNNAGYSPENCRWVTRQVNSRNRRSNRVIQTPEGPMQLCAAAEVSGIGKTTLMYRHRAGWPSERMFDIPDVTNRV